ncbi:hypothetical protein Tco_0123218 [Tanacetum coccineum]
MQLNELAELRDGAYENTRIYKERTKKWHDSRLRGNKDFKVGDKVLLYNSRLKMYPGKLKSKWSGSNIVKMVYPYGAVEIIDKNGCNFKVNGQRLKKYYECDIDKEVDEVIEFENGDVAGKEIDKVAEVSIIWNPMCVVGMLAQHPAHSPTVVQQPTSTMVYTSKFTQPHPGQGVLDPTPAHYASPATSLPSAFSTMTLQDLTWHIDTEFDAFDFSAKDFLARHILLRCDRPGDLYPVTKPSTTPTAFLSTSTSTWYQRLGHPGDEVLRFIVSRQFISKNMAGVELILHHENIHRIVMRKPGTGHG